MSTVSNDKDEKITSHVIEQKCVSSRLTNKYLFHSCISANVESTDAKFSLNVT